MKSRWGHRPLWWWRRSYAVLVLVAAAACTTTAHAQDPEALFDVAVGAYQRGRFDSAAVGFTRLAQGGIDDARVWYDLGNAHFKSGHIGAALVSYRRGLRLAPRDADLRANYGYVRLFAADKIDPVGVFFLERWWQSLMDRLSLAEAQFLAALSFWLAALLTAWRLWPGRIRRVGLGLVVVAWILWVGATGASATCYLRDVLNRRGAVVAVKTDVRGGPGADYALQFVAHDGLLGIVERSESGWYLVRFPNGLKGWIAASDFEAM
ncbi:MAG TPA: tetratricopeptide repeat protein [Acidobacteriota bacterium]|nr:tetratricopeptide repeat protein [Acidobacteriota bacterium]